MGVYTPDFFHKHCYTVCIDYIVIVFAFGMCMQQICLLCNDQLLRESHDRMTGLDTNQAQRLTRN